MIKGKRRKYGKILCLHTFFSSAETKEKADYYVELLEQITPDELISIIRDTHKNARIIDAVKELIKKKKKCNVNKLRKTMSREVL